LQIMAYAREFNNKKIAVIANFDHKEVALNLDFTMKEVILSNYDHLELHPNQLKLRPYESIVCEIDSSF
ncbi:glucohydrolase, partial [Priestia aryabhattai]|nr:glucohydrolase [Priestia aryabhattai]